MENYYDEILQEIEEKIQKGELDDASFLLKKELSMPYIPSDIEQKLFALKKDLTYAKSEKSNSHEESTDDLVFHLMHGRAKTQLSAADALQKKNLRNCVEELQEYLSKDPCPEAAAIIVEALAEQEIDDEFTLRRDGLEYTFFADEVIPVPKSKGFLLAYKELDQKYAKNPSLLQMARTLLIHEAYMYLPLSYEESEVGYLLDLIDTKLNQLM